MGKSSLNVWWRGMKGFLKPEKLGHWGGSCPGELSFEQGPPVAPRRDSSAWAKLAKVTHWTMGIFGFQPFWILNSCWVFISYIQLYYTSVIQRFLLEETSNLDCFSHCCGILQDFQGAFCWSFSVVANSQATACIFWWRYLVPLVGSPPALPRPRVVE